MPFGYNFTAIKLKLNFEQKIILIFLKQRLTWNEQFGSTTFWDWKLIYGWKMKQIKIPIWSYGLED